MYFDNSGVVLFMAWKGVNLKGRNDDQRIFYSYFDGSSWTPQQVLSDRGTSTSPALANWHLYTGTGLDERLFMAWKGVHDDQRIFFSSFDVSKMSWSPQQVLPDRGTSTSPALAVTSIGIMHMAWKGVHDDQRIFFSIFYDDSGKWSPQQVLPDRGTSTSPALAVSSSSGRWPDDKNDLFMAWKGVHDDQRIFYSILEDGSSSWSPQQVLPDRGTSTSPTLTENNNTVYMAWKGVHDDQRIFFSTLDRLGSGKWSPQQVLPDRGTSTSPALATRQGRVYMAWKGVHDDQRIFYSYFVGGAWTPQQVLPDRGTSTSPALANFVLPS